MALAKQFYSSFKSYNGWDYYLEIWVEGYGGSASEITLGAGGPVITYGTDEQDRFSSILSSKLELPFMVTNTTEDAFVKNIREQFNEQDVYIHLYRESSSGYSSVAPLWSGFVLMDLSASPDLYYPYPVTLTAVDGLSLLKEIDFVQSGTAGSYTDSDMYSSNGRFTYWIKEILLKSGASTTAEGSTQDYKFTTAINWFNSVMPTITQSTDPFYQTKCNTQMFFSKDANDNFTVVNCYDVLKNLLKHWGARIIYWKHIYYIVQIQEYNTAESGTYANPDNIDTRTYTKTGAFDGSSDNLGDSYWTRYNLLIDDVTGGIQKLTGTQFNYLPQLKRTQANFIDYGNKNYYGGLPFDLTTGQNDVIKQATLVDVSTDGTMILIIPLDVTMVTQYQGVLNMLLYFRLYITDGVTTYYLRYDPSNTPKYYWEDDSNINLNTKRTFWKSDLDNIVGTQTKVGFHQQIDFVDVNGSALTLNGEWDVFTDIDNWGSNNGSFIFKYAITGPFTYTPVYTPSATTIYWTNTLNPAYQSPLNLSIIGTTTQQSYNSNYYNNIGSQNNNIVTYTTSLNQNPFEGKLLIVNTSSSGALYGSFVSVSPSPTTNDSQIVDFGELIWGDTLLASSEGSLKVWNGSSFVKSNVIGTWGLGSTSGTNSFTEMLLSEYLYGQTKVIESPSMRLVIGETNKNQNDGSGSRPNYVNPIGRLKGYSATGTTPYYIFKSGSFHLLKDEIDYQGYQIIRDPQTLTKTDDVIIGPDILQDKTNIIGQKTPQTNSLINKVTQNSFITTTSALKSAYGNDIAVNGIFASDTGWTKGTGWSIASNKASFSPTGSASDIKQDTLTNALTYKIVVSLTLSAGALSVKAGSSGNATVLSASGTYEIFSTCAGSTEVIFEASAAFEGYIEKVVVQQQVPVTSISINAIGEAVFKTNDVLNIADVDGSDVNQFTVSADQGASDTSISVTSKLITEDILEGSIILVNQNDLAAQYQNKTKGTVGGFDITANSIDSGSVSIESYIDDDTFGTASATSLATSESIKAYVDTQVGSADTLQEVTDNGNTTTNSITIGSSSSPEEKLSVNGNIQLGNQKHLTWSDIGDGNTLRVSIKGDEDNDFIAFRTDNSERMRLTNTGLGVGTTSPSDKLQVSGGNILLDTNTYIGSGSSSGQPRLRFDNTNSLIKLQQGDLILNDEKSIGWSNTGTAIQGRGTDNQRIEFNVASSERMRLTSAGRLGIGLTNVLSQLHVFESSTEVDRNAGITVEQGSTGDSLVQYLLTGVRRWVTGIDNSDNDSFKISSSERLNSDNVLTLTTGGNVGINQQNPTEKLHVVGDSLVTGDSHADAFKPAVSGNPIKFKNFDSSTEFARITDGGNLLIGTTTGSEKLVVDGNIQVNGSMDSADGLHLKDRTFIAFSDESSVVSRFRSSSTGVFQFQDGSFNTGIELRTNGRSYFNGGNVLIGTTTDDGSSKLQVDGDVKFFGDTSGRDMLWDASQDRLEFNDNVKAVFGTNADLTIYHDGSNSIINQQDGKTGNLVIQQDTNDADIIFKADDGSGGVTEYFRINGGLSSPYTNFPDNSTLSFGGSNDLRIYHDGTNNNIQNVNGELKILQYADDSDIVFYSDNGTGGLAEYIRIDGSQTTINLQKTVLIGTTTNTGAYKIDVAGKQRVQDTLELDDVLMLNAISTPSDPAAGKSVIYMDSSDGGIKCKINVGGTVVTRTIASFE